MTSQSEEPIGRIFKSAEGHLSFEMADYPAEKVMELIEILQRQFGFESGLPVLGLDEVVCEGRIEGIELAVGNDIWSGCYIMAFDDTGDDWVRKMGDFINDRSAPRQESSPKLRKQKSPQHARPKTARPKPKRKRSQPGTAGPPPSVSEQMLDQAATKFLSQSRKIHSGNCCVLENEWEGYTATQLEEGLRQCINHELSPGVEGGARWLTASRLRDILEGVLNCRPAIAAYRERLISECGDYGNAFSPLAAPVRNLVDVLRKTLNRQKEAAKLLAVTPAEILDESLRLYFVSSDGRLDDYTLTLREHLTQLDQLISTRLK